MGGGGAGGAYRYVNSYVLHINECCRHRVTLTYFSTQVSNKEHHGSSYFSFILNENQYPILISLCKMKREIDLVFSFCAVLVFFFHFKGTE